MANKLIKILDCIPGDIMDNYDNWLKILTLIKKFIEPDSLAIEIAIKTSKKNIKYKNENDVIDQLFKCKKKAKIGINWLKNEFASIQSNFWNNNDCAKRLFEIYGSKNFYINYTKQWYCLNKYNCWKKQFEPDFYIGGNIPMVLTPIIKKYLNTTIKKQTILNRIEKYVFMENTFKHTRNLMTKQLDFKNKLDNYPYYIVFKNKIYDAEHDSFIDISSSMYLTDCIDHEIKPQQNDIYNKQIDDFFMKTYNNDINLLNFAKQWIGYNLLGVSHEKKFLCQIGNGNNGKSTAIELLQKLFPIYVKKSNSSLILLNDKTSNKKYKDGCDINFNLCRCLYIDELGDNNKYELDTSTIKELVNNDPYYNLPAFASNLARREKINFSLNIISNNPLKFKSDGGIQNRGLMIRHTNKFCDHEYEIETTKNPLGNNYIKQDIGPLNNIDFLNQLYLWFLNCTKLYMKNRLNGDKSTMDKLNEQFDMTSQQNTDPIEEWISDNLEVSEGLIHKDDMINRFENTSGMKLFKIQFNKKLYHIFGIKYNKCKKYKKKRGYYINCQFTKISNDMFNEKFQCQI